MKVTIVHTNNKKQLLVSTKTMEKLMERFARDDSKQSITHFRESVPYLSNNYEGYKDMPKWMHIYPAAEFTKDENNNLKMKAFNGILLLKFGNITDVDGAEGVKRSVAILPSTLAAITGADGKTVIVLIKFQGENDSLPTSEADAEHRLPADFPCISGYCQGFDSRRWSETFYRGWLFPIPRAFDSQQFHDDARCEALFQRQGSGDED